MAGRDEPRPDRKSHGKDGENAPAKTNRSEVAQIRPLGHDTTPVLLLAIQRTDGRTGLDGPGSQLIKEPKETGAALVIGGRAVGLRLLGPIRDEIRHHLRERSVSRRGFLACSLTIVHVYPDGNAYEVEFVALDGRTTAFATVEAGQVRRASRMDMTHAREAQTV